LIPQKVTEHSATNKNKNMPTPSQILSQENLSDQELALFVNNLVMAILGYSILDIEEDKRQEVIDDCIKIFSDYIVSYTEIKYGKTEATRLKASQVYNDPKIFTRFAQLGSIFDEAYNSFLEFLSQRLESNKSN
jgi:hypothetical protein